MDKIIIILLIIGIILINQYIYYIGWFKGFNKGHVIDDNSMFELSKNDTENKKN